MENQQVENIQSKKPKTSIKRILLIIILTPILFGVGLWLYFALAICGFSGCN